MPFMINPWAKMFVSMKKICYLYELQKQEKKDFFKFVTMEPIMEPYKFPFKLSYINKT